MLDAGEGGAHRGIDVLTGAATESSHCPEAVAPGSSPHRPGSDTGGKAARALGIGLVRG